MRKSLSYSSFRAFLDTSMIQYWYKEAQTASILQSGCKDHEKNKRIYVFYWIYRCESGRRDDFCANSVCGCGAAFLYDSHVRRVCRAQQLQNSGKQSGIPSRSKKHAALCGRGDTAAGGDWSGSSACAQQDS